MTRLARRTLLAAGPRPALLARDGTQPGEIPFEQSSKLELVISLSTARALGLALLRPLLARADEVIE